MSFYRDVKYRNLCIHELLEIIHFFFKSILYNDIFNYRELSRLETATIHSVLSAFKSVLLERNAKEQHAEVQIYHLPIILKC